MKTITIKTKYDLSDSDVVYEFLYQGDSIKVLGKLKPVEDLYVESHAYELLNRKNCPIPTLKDFFQKDKNAFIDYLSWEQLDGNCNSEKLCDLLFRYHTYLQPYIDRYISKLDYLYILKVDVENSPVFKIGVSQNVRKRVAQLQTGTPFRIEIFRKYRVEYAYGFEKQFHQEFANKNTTNEWFLLSNDDIKFIEQMISPFRWDRGNI